MKFFARAFLSVFGIGFAPIAPGTFGSLAAAVVIYFLQPTVFIYSAQTKILILFAAVLLIFLFGWLLVPFAVKQDFDQKWIVLDEVAGQLVAVAPLLFQTKNFLFELVCAFLIFRFFDISKIGSKKIDALGTPFSVFADDIVAGIFAAISLYLIQFLF